MPILKHVHTYIRVKVTKDGKYFLYRCANKDCTHREDKKFLEGKASRCTKCGDEFTLTYEDLRNAKPQCMDCKDTVKSRKYKAAKQVVSNLFGESI